MAKIISKLNVNVILNANIIHINANAILLNTSINAANLTILNINAKVDFAANRNIAKYKK